MSEFQELLSCAQEAKAWLFERAAPLWSDAGFHSDGTFAEELTLEGQQSSVQRRLRVQARQIYSFCLIGRAGWKGPWEERARTALQILLERGRRDDGFFGHTFSPSGILQDNRADLYDHAFILLCLGQSAETFGRSDLIDVADDLLDKIEEQWRHARGGYREGEIVGMPRRQNPHMHLLEAAMTLWRVSGRKRWMQLVEEIGHLCSAQFIEPESGALTEYFAEDWSRLPGDEGRVVEPGHCFEWSWLFETIGTDHAIENSNRLTSFARRFGIDRARGTTINEVLVNGAERDRGIRLWPQTERTRCALARYRRTGKSEEARDAILAFRGLQHHLETPVPGLWRERFSSNGEWVEQPAPASSFYHIVGAFVELFRTAES